MRLGRRHSGASLRRPSSPPLFPRTPNSTPTPSPTRLAPPSSSPISSPPPARARSPPGRWTRPSLGRGSRPTPGTRCWRRRGRWWRRRSKSLERRARPRSGFAGAACTRRSSPAALLPTSRPPCSPTRRCSPRPTSTACARRRCFWSTGTTRRCPTRSGPPSRGRSRGSRARRWSTTRTRATVRGGEGEGAGVVGEASTRAVANAPPSPSLRRPHAARRPHARLGGRVLSHGGVDQGALVRGGGDRLDGLS